MVWCLLSCFESRYPVQVLNEKLCVILFQAACKHNFESKCINEHQCVPIKPGWGLTYNNAPYTDCHWAFVHTPAHGRWASQYVCILASYVCILESAVPMMSAWLAHLYESATTHYYALSNIHFSGAIYYSHHVCYFLQCHDRMSESASWRSIDRLIYFTAINNWAAIIIANASVWRTHIPWPAEPFHTVVL